MSTPPARSLQSAINLDDLRELARRKLPRIAFDFIDGGADDEHCLRRNREAFQRYRLVPRYLRDVTMRDPSVVLFGHDTGRRRAGRPEWAASQGRRGYPPPIIARLFPTPAPHFPRTP